ncbi:MAG TPA: aminotransferase class I/II-fold pyridoxal phosphate-dependent enzyme [Chthoniobacterales bacterium]|jgi:Histidinol-phosphate/aromatic aminotransferase and cobyric acid decarboxylase|nr:aminotransferase class I/II-fold pyridoxal phosphate-dependent enzyme [Chthoniobacterales bacterium]
MKTHSISRRHFAQLLGVGAAAAIIRPRITVAKQTATVPAPTKAGMVRLSANENPYGPSAHAHEAMKSAHPHCNRYPDEANDVLIDKIAKINNCAREQIVLGDGSSEILKICAETFTGPTQGKLIAADPTFESILEYSKANGAEVVKVPLTSSHAHDLEKMTAAAQKGLIYICNPNNPTASITPKNDLRDFITKTPPETMILVDEAYFHYADSPDYESVIPLVKDHPNLLVARTFSKIYGMAGLRCGYCVAQPETIKRMHGFQMFDSVNVMALAAASASLDDVDQVTNGRKMNAAARSYTLGELDGMGYKSIPSQANFIMFDCKKPVVPLIQAMKDKNVAVGRLFPAYPNHMRLTIGKQSEMEAFVSAFKQIMAA